MFKYLYAWRFALLWDLAHLGLQWRLSGSLPLSLQLNHCFHEDKSLHATFHIPHRLVQCLECMWLVFSKVGRLVGPVNKPLKSQIFAISELVGIKDVIHSLRTRNALRQWLAITYEMQWIVPYLQEASLYSGQRWALLTPLWAPSYPTPPHRVDPHSGGLWLQSRVHVTRPRPQCEAPDLATVSGAY